MQDRINYPANPENRVNPVYYYGLTERDVSDQNGALQSFVESELHRSDCVEINSSERTQRHAIRVTTDEMDMRLREDLVFFG